MNYRDINLFKNIFSLLPYANLEFLRILQGHQSSRIYIPKKDIQYVTIDNYCSRFLNEFALPDNILNEPTNVVTAFGLMWNILRNGTKEVETIKNLADAMVGYESEEFRLFYIAVKKLSGENDSLYFKIDYNYLQKFDKEYLSSSDVLIDYYFKNAISEIMIHFTASMESLFNHLLKHFTLKANGNTKYMMSYFNKRILENIIDTTTEYT